MNYGGSSMSQWTADTVTKQSELAHYPWALRRPLQLHCTVIRLLVTLFPHTTSFESQAARNSMQKIEIAHTVNFNQSPLLCVSPPCSGLGIPLGSGWHKCRRAEVSRNSWWQREVWSVNAEGCGGDAVGRPGGRFQAFPGKIQCDEANKLELFHKCCWPATGSADNVEHLHLGNDSGPTTWAEATIPPLPTPHRQPQSSISLLASQRHIVLTAAKNITIDWI